MSKKSQKNQPKANAMWGGHYANGPAEAFAAINPSIGFDKRLWQQDIEGSLAHAEMLKAQGIISAADARAIQKGLAQVTKEIQAGKFAIDPALEDIHMHIEARLREIIGDAAGRLHTARSRNDQVATDTRLYARTTAEEIGKEIQLLRRALLTQAEAHTNTMLPGMTHLQPAQPISFAFHLMAYVEMFGRDHGRLADAAARLNECPLGAAALAGTSYPIDRKKTAKALGFDYPMRNAMDAVSARDYLLELLSAFSIHAVHLSRLAEEIVFWASPLVGFVKLPESFTSGSSIMPQKRNPDAAELVRGKAGVVAAQFQSLLITMKSLPLAYNKDTQEDKPPFFKAADELRLCIAAMRGMVEGLAPQVDVMRAACESGYLNATDLADYLVQTLGLPFRDAHHITGKIVRHAETKKIRLEDVPLKAMQKIHAKIGRDIYDFIALDACMKRRNSFGGTAPIVVKRAIRAAKKEIG
jgi:argininosuccinate lyase